MIKSRLVPFAVIGAAGVALAGCGSTSAPVTPSAPEVSVTATDTTCQLGTTSIAPGSTTFNVTNAGSQVTEVYVYGKSGDAFTTVVSEVENIGPGTSRKMTTDLAAGTYQVACKPGQTGSGIRADLTVVGSSSASGSASASGAASASHAATVIALTTDGKTISGPTSGKTGAHVEFAVTNNASAARVFEVKRPDGSVAGEVEIAAGKVGRLVVMLTPGGSWQLIIEGGPTEVTSAFTVS